MPRHDKPVSLLELEMQAEVDKYVASHLLLRRQCPGHFPLELRRVLFRAGAPGSAPERRARAPVPRGEPLRGALLPTSGEHRAGAHAAGSAAGVADREVLAELRRFYRLTHARKRAHIERTSA